MKAALAVIALATLAACSAHVTADVPTAAGGSNPSQSKVQQLKVGSAGQPAQNEIDAGTELAAGGAVSFTWHADKSGTVDVEPGSAVAVNCDLGSVQPKVYLDSPSSSQEIQAPQKIDVVANTDYVVRFQFPANSCAGVSITFTVAWVDPPAAKPSPVAAPEPKQAPGFLGEEPLGAMGGAIDTKNPQTDSVYRDYLLTTASTQQVYMNAGSGSSSCATTKKLQLLEIAQDGSIAQSQDMDLGTFRTIAPGKFYRLRWTVSGVKGCAFVFESFNVGYASTSGPDISFGE